MNNAEKVVGLINGLDRLMTMLIATNVAAHGLTLHEADCLALGLSATIAGRLEASLDPDDEEAMKLVATMKAAGAAMVEAIRASKQKPH